MEWFGRERSAEIARRFGTRATRASGDAVRVGFVFGPRALRRHCGRVVPVLVTGTDGRQRKEMRRFRDAAAIARFIVAELNRSFVRARIDARLAVGAVTQLSADETLPSGPHPGAWLSDLCTGRADTGHGALPLECWAAARRVNCVLVLVDWRMSRRRIERGGWAGFAPRAPERGRGTLRFWPVAIADLRCALTAHSAAHEFGHMVGCGHDNAGNPLAPRARGFVARGSGTFTVMAAARRNERGRRLEWSRTGASGARGQFGDRDHDEAAWLRRVLPRLARQRFRCHGLCEGACAGRTA